LIFDLALDAMSGMIESTLREMAGEKLPPEADRPDAIVLS